MATEFNCGVYSIKSPSGKVYVGSSKNLRRRLKRYQNGDCKLQPRLFNSLRKYGYSSHVVSVLEVCEPELLHVREAYWGCLFEVLSDKGLNCALPKSSEYPAFSEERRMKISKVHKGKKTSEEAKLKMSKAKMGVKRGLYNEEHKLNISKGHSNSKVDYKIVLDVNLGIYFRSCTEAAKAFNLSKSHLSRMLTGRRRNKTNLIYC